MQLTPEDDHGWGRTLSKQPAFWNRIALQHLRAYGVRRPFLVVYSLDGWHRELVLAVPLLSSVRASCWSTPPGRRPFTTISTAGSSQGCGCVIS